MPLGRRHLLSLVASLPLAAALWPPATADAAASADIAAIRAWVRLGVERETGGGLQSVFDLDPSISATVLLAATKVDALPNGYAPRDAVSAAGRGIPAAAGQVISALIVDDTRALIEAATAEGHRLYVGSGYRSQSYQVAVFAAQVARWGDEETANRYSARPGYSQHQLGTTIDFTTDFRGFRASGGPDWMRDNAHQFGFVLPYTAAAVERTGYIEEPWHGRWVGRALAGRLQAAGYQDWTDFDADDVIALVRAEAGLDA